jgi:hypothetical protein
MYSWTNLQMIFKQVVFFVSVDLSNSSYRIYLFSSTTPNSTGQKTSRPFIRQTRIVSLFRPPNELLHADTYVKALINMGNHSHLHLQSANTLSRPSLVHREASQRRIYGRIHGLPPQHGIPGFQRVSFLKFCLGDNDEFDPLSVWGYEGCVFPGNRIMVGRWRWISPDSEVEEDEDVYSGPFIFWNVTESHAEPPIKPEEALDFLQDLKDLWKGF